LFILGLETEACDELNRLVQKTRRDKKRFLVLNRMLADQGRYAQALRNLKLYAPELLEKMKDDHPPDFWWVAYPQGMRDEVESIAKESRVNPDLVTAVIREESHYDPEAISPAGAVGLMQLMPTTAHWMAKRINLDSFTRDQLRSPSVNIKLGAHYLAFLLERFEGEPITAVAAYNAGPESVTRWQETVQSEDRDEFLEQIPFQETRSFVKRVMRSYYEYERLQKLRQRAPPGDLMAPPGDSTTPPGDLMAPPGDLTIPPGDESPGGMPVFPTPSEDRPALPGDSRAPPGN
jgi:soluble lytic murein transglycosylase